MVRRTTGFVGSVLTIAGSDSGGGAGIQADLKTFAAHGVWRQCDHAAVTAQNTERVAAVHVLPPSIVAAQIDAVASDIRLDGVKTGMLATAAIVEAVAAAIARWRLPQVVIDPVMVAKSGDSSSTNANRGARPAAAPLCGGHAESPRSRGACGHASAHPRRGPRGGAPHCRQRLSGVVIKGGHFEGHLINLLFDGRDFTEIESERVERRARTAPAARSPPRLPRSSLAGAACRTLSEGQPSTSQAPSATRCRSGTVTGP